MSTHALRSTARRRAVTRAIGALMLSASLAACTGPERDPHGASSAETALASTARATAVDVARFLTHYIATLEARDPDAVRALFVDDERFAWFTDGERSYASPDEVLAGMQRYAELTFRTQLSDVQITPLDPRHAAASTRFVTELSGAEMPAYRYGGVITLIVERTDGGWRILRGHTSTPAGPPRGADSAAYGDDRR